jgi:hypothetical protein
MSSRPTLAALLLLASGFASAQDSASLNVVGVRGKTVALTVADLQGLFPRTVEMADPHSKEKEAYLVVPLSKVLALVDVPFGTLLKGPALAATVRAEAPDGYRVAFSLVELDLNIACSEVFVAFQRDGKPLPKELGPFRLIVPTDRRGLRSVRQLSRVTLVE